MAASAPGSTDRTVPPVGADTVSVVIPTRGRPEMVVRAVRTALDQTRPPEEIVVVVDGPDEATERALAALGAPSVKAVVLERSGGAGAARNAGIRASSGDWVAFLDDDDEWKPTKLAVQLSIVPPTADRSKVVLACVAEWRRDEHTYNWPTRSKSPTEPLGDYMFIRRSPGEGLLSMPTIVVPRQLALAHPIPEHLPTHEEWDWYLTLEAAGAEFLVCMDSLAIVNAPRVRASVSADTGWRETLAWVLTRRSDLTPRAFSEFCLSEAARVAKRDGAILAMIRIAFLARGGHASPLAWARFLALAVTPVGLKPTVYAAAQRIRRAARLRGSAA